MIRRAPEVAQAKPDIFWVEISTPDIAAAIKVLRFVLKIHIAAFEQGDAKPGIGELAGKRNSRRSSTDDASCRQSYAASRRDGIDPTFG
jgi:hypothetical protein